MNSLVLHRARGFTLIELLITVALVVVLLTLGVPSMKSFFDRERLIGATEQIYSHLQQARIEAISRSRPIYTEFKVTAGSLEYGFSQNDGCDPSIDDPTQANACVLIIDSGDGSATADLDIGSSEIDNDDLVLMSFDILGYEEGGITYDSGTFGIDFEPLRGIPSNTSEVQMTLSSALDREMKIRVGPLGQISICSDGTIDGYSTCP
jgi:prepilin-type N-terminal cleavage/methylation domain-containing protein